MFDFECQSLGFLAELVNDGLIMCDLAFCKVNLLFQFCKLFLMAGKLCGLSGLLLGLPFLFTGNSHLFPFQSNQAGGFCLGLGLALSPLCRHSGKLCAALGLFCPLPFNLALPLDFPACVDTIRLWAAAW